MNVLTDEIVDQLQIIEVKDFSDISQTIIVTDCRYRCSGVCEDCYFCDNTCSFGCEAECQSNCDNSCSGCEDSCTGDCDMTE